MRKGLKIDFTENGPTLNAREAVSGYDSVLQNLAVNTATTNGTDLLYPQKGTTILSEVLRYGYVSESRVQHQANFAALNTKVFHRVTKPADVPEISGITMKAGRSSTNRLTLSVTAKFGATTNAGSFTL